METPRNIDIIYRVEESDFDEHGDSSEENYTSVNETENYKDKTLWIADYLNLSLLFKIKDVYNKI